MPTFFAVGDAIRVGEQISVVAPFYAGLAYSVGAIAETHDLVKKIFGNSGMRPETETTEMEENADRHIVSEPEKPVHELD